MTEFQSGQHWDNIAILINSCEVSCIPHLYLSGLTVFTFTGLTTGACFNKKLCHNWIMMAFHEIDKILIKHLRLVNRCLHGNAVELLAKTEVYSIIILCHFIWRRWPISKLLRLTHVNHSVLQTAHSSKGSGGKWCAWLCEIYCLQNLFIV